MSVDGGKPILMPTSVTSGWHPYWRAVVITLGKLPAGEHKVHIYMTKDGTLSLDAILLADGESMNTGVLLKQ